MGQSVYFRSGWTLTLIFGSVRSMMQRYEVGHEVICILGLQFSVLWSDEKRVNGERQWPRFRVHVWGDPDEVATRRARWEGWPPLVEP